MNYNNQIGSSFQHDKQKWENAIINYNGNDPLDLWYNFICWYEQNIQYDHERLFETALSKCLTVYECQQHYNQDTRMVRLWMKYIDLKPNPLNLYQVLYTRGIGTQCAIFYVGWAHYYDSANAFKQAESVFNLGFQAKAQPFRELEEAHKSFRLSISQRMLYDDQQSKKRTASHLNDQRQQITSLKPQTAIATSNNNCQPSINYNNHVYTNGDGGSAGGGGGVSDGSNESYHAQKKIRREEEWPRTERRVDEQWMKLDDAMAPKTNGCHPASDNKSMSTQSQNHTKITPHSYQATPAWTQKVTITELDSAACVISSSLNSVYDDSDDGNAYDYNGDTTESHYVTAVAESIVTPDIDKCEWNRINIPSDFVCTAKNHHEVWMGALYLDEPDVNKICRYPRHLVYPGNGSEYSLEEIRARNYTTIIESIKERNRHREQMESKKLTPMTAVQMQPNHQTQQHQPQPHPQLQPQHQPQQQSHPHPQQQHQQHQQQHNNSVEHASESFVQHSNYYDGQHTMQRSMTMKPVSAQQQQQQQQPQQFQQLQQQQPIPYQNHHQQPIHPARPIPSQHIHHHHQQQQQAAVASPPPIQYQAQHQHQHQPMTYHPQQHTMQYQSQPPQSLHYQPQHQQQHSTMHYPSQLQQQPHQPIHYHHEQMQYHSQQQQRPILHHQQLPQQPAPVPPQTSQQLPQPLSQMHQYNHIQHQTQCQQTPPQPPYHLSLQQYQSNSRLSNPNDTNNIAPIINNVNHFEDDIEEQIEASTILLDNGQSKPQKITIKFRKERSEAKASSSSSTNTVPSLTASTQPKTKQKKKKKKNVPQSAIEQTYVGHHGTDDDDSLLPPTFTSSNDSYSSAISTKATVKSKTKSSSSTFELMPDDAPSQTSPSEYDESDDENSRNGTPSEGAGRRFNFTCVASTPIRNHNNNINNNHIVAASAPVTPAHISSKSSTPRSSYRMLRRRTSNASLPNHTFTENDDSMTSFSMVEPNSFFETENDEELRQQRLEKALKTIDEHMLKPHLDPFSSELCKAFLTKCGFPSHEHNSRYKLSNALLSKLSNTKNTTIGEHRFNIEKEVGRGAYGSVYRATNGSTGDIVALKYQKPPNTWELYICHEVKQKLKDRDMLLGFMDISSAIIAPNASIFVTEFSQFGSLLDINNRVRQATTKVMHESLVMHFTSQILNIVHHLHSCNIIHGDIKPDNFLLMKIPNTSSHVPTLRLIDFGCAIDMNFFEPNTQFRKIIQTDGFTCPEMLEGLPWSYQTDIFCIAGTVHVMLFGEYMQMVKKSGQYEIKQKLPRYLKKHIWTEFFSKFLNIKDLRHSPNLLAFKSKIDDEVYNMESELQSQIRTLSNILHKR